MPLIHVVIAVGAGEVQYYVKDQERAAPLDFGTDNNEDWREFADDLRTCGHYETFPALDGGELFFAAKTRDDLLPEG